MQINFFKLSKSTKIHRNDTLQFNLPKQTHKSNQFNLSSPFLFTIQVTNDRGMLKTKNIQVTQFNQVFLRIIERLIIQKVSRYTLQRQQITNLLKLKFMGRMKNSGVAERGLFWRGGGLLNSQIPEGEGINTLEVDPKVKKFQSEMGYKK